MENPTFRLEGVIKGSKETEDFEGPLLLILQLLSRNRIDIKDIKISDLLQQYLDYLDKMKYMDLDIASEFTAMASHLVYIKAKALTDSDEKPSELEELIQSLEKLKNRDIYERLGSVAAKLNEMYRKNTGIFTREQEYFSPDREYRYSHDKAELYNSVMRVLTRDNASVAAAVSPFYVPDRIVYPVSEKAEELLDMLARRGTRKISDIIADGKSRTEIVATFIALLELCRAGRIMFTDEGEDTMVSRLSADIVYDESAGASYEYGEQ